jgi:hypothetical protein
LQFVVVPVKGETLGEEVDADGGLNGKIETCSSVLKRWLTNCSMILVLPTWQSPSRMTLYVLTLFALVFISNLTTYYNPVNNSPPPITLAKYSSPLKSLASFYIH